MLNIVYSCSDTYAYITGVSITSLLENNQNENFRIFIINNNISPTNIEKLLLLAKKYKTEMIFIPFFDIEKNINFDIHFRRWNKSTFGRLFMASLLPMDVDWALNIDCDTIVLGSIRELFNYKRDDITFCGVSECINFRYKRNIHKDEQSKYFNGGLVLLNLKNVREKGYEQQFADYIEKNGECLQYLDQDVINAVIPEREKLELPLKFDVLSPYFYLNYKQVCQMRNCFTFYSQKEFEQAKRFPSIVHFTSFFLEGKRPWMQGCNHPLTSKFLFYKSISPWANISLEDNKEGSLKKASKYLLKKCPKFIMVRLVGIIHGFFVPNKVYRKIKKYES